MPSALIEPADAGAPSADAPAHASDAWNARASRPIQRPPRVWKLGGRILLGLLVVAGAGAAAWVASTVEMGGGEKTLVFYTVTRGDLPINITESGNLQSQITTELRCAVENLGPQREGTQILTIVPDGADVKRGELLVELDSALIEERLDEQELGTERARSKQIQETVRYENQITQNETTLAEATLQVELAELALKQYEDEDGGTFQLELQNIDLQIQTAEANRMIKATDLTGIETLKKLGYRSTGDLEQARLAKLSADREVATAISSRKELVEYTYRKNKMKLQGDLASAKRNLIQIERDNQALLMQAKAAKDEADRALEKEEEKLAKYQEQLKNCKIFAPHDGMATYPVERWGRTEIEEGATVRERQTIISLPDLRLMEVKTRVHESVLDKVRAGLPATITVDAFPDLKYHGTVKSVAVLADRGEWHSSDVKVYSTIVTIDEPVLRLRPGMSAVVNIHVETVKDVLTMPVQAIVQVARESWVYVDVSGKIERRRVTLGKTDDKFVEICEGVSEGDRVVLNPMALADGGRNDKKDKDDEADDQGEAAGEDEPADDDPAEGRDPAEAAAESQSGPDDGEPAAPTADADDEESPSDQAAATEDVDPINQPGVVIKKSSATSGGGGYAPRRLGGGGRRRDGPRG